MAEWSKALVSGTSLEKGVGSNPTLVILHAAAKGHPCRIDNGRQARLEPYDFTMIGSGGVFKSLLNQAGRLHRIRGEPEVQ